MWVLVNRLCKRHRQESHAPPLPPFQCFEASDFCKWNTRATRTRPSKFFELEQPQNRNARKTLNGGEGGRGFLKLCCLYKMGFGFVPQQIHRLGSSQKLRGLEILDGGGACRGSVAMGSNFDRRVDRYVGGFLRQGMASGFSSVLKMQFS